VQASGGIDDQDVTSLLLRLAERPFGDIDRAALGALLWTTLVWFELDAKAASGNLARIRRALEATA
jgi:hypothetical protein